MKTFKDYYKFPLKTYDFDISYIWTQDNEMAFNYIGPDKYEKEALERRDHLVSIINGDTKGTFDNVEISKYDPTVIVIDEVPSIMIRGWGMLTSPNSFNLSHKEAAKIQDEFRDYIINKLKGK